MGKALRQHGLPIEDNYVEMIKSLIKGEKVKLLVNDKTNKNFNKSLSPLPSMALKVQLLP